ncbi:hypothetical protein [Paraflavitalea speifideaquila]|uniref:TlpA family protein disulfide reductase n=1 Tax=Paraflavitalea speifideaquila TaxID=3076558 RepID=UPI0028E550A9|nr:hypothetical protein [Paraflavitalea speifideiaquila]
MIFFLILIFQAWLVQAQSTVWVSGTIDNLGKDSIRVGVLLDGVTSQFLTLKVAVVNRAFGVRIPVKQPALATYKIGGYHVFTQNKGREHAMIKDYQVNGYPTTYIIGPDGKMAVVKPARNAQGLIKEIEAVLPH